MSDEKIEAWFWCLGLASTSKKKFMEREAGHEISKNDIQLIRNFHMAEKFQKLRQK